MTEPAAKTHWHALVLHEGDMSQTWPYAPGDIDFMRSLKGYRDTGALEDYYLLPLPGQALDREQMWMWGPDTADVDWTGLDEEIAATEAVLARADSW